MEYQWYFFWNSYLLQRWTVKRCTTTKQPCKQFNCPGNISGEHNWPGSTGEFSTLLRGYFSSMLVGWKKDEISYIKIIFFPPSCLPARTNEGAYPERHKGRSAGNALIRCTSTKSFKCISWSLWLEDNIICEGTSVERLWVGSNMRTNYVDWGPRDHGPFQIFRKWVVYTFCV